MRKAASFTLLEVLLSAAIGAIIFLTLYSGFSLGMKVYKRTYLSAYTQAQEIFRKISADLASSYIYPEKNSSLTFVGSQFSLQFVRTPLLRKSLEQGKHYGLLRVRYYLVPTGQDLYSLVSTQDPLGIPANISRQIKENQLATNISELRFSYFNGKAWQGSWNSTLILPQQVKISFGFQPDAKSQVLDSYSTIVDIACKQ